MLRAPTYYWQIEHHVNEAFFNLRNDFIVSSLLHFHYELRHVFTVQSCTEYHTLKPVSYNVTHPLYTKQSNRATVI